MEAHEIAVILKSCFAITITIPNFIIPSISFDLNNQHNPGHVDVDPPKRRQKKPRGKNRLNVIDGRSKEENKGVSLCVCVCVCVIEVNHA